MNQSDLLALFLHFLTLSVFATGGAISLASDMHRYVVDQHGYITHTEFINSIAMAQAAPGPNIMFVTVMGWQIAGVQGALATTLGMAIPALVFPMLVSRLGQKAKFERALRSIQRGLGPVAIGLMASTSFLLIREAPGVWIGPLIIAVTVAVLSLTTIPPVWMILAAGAIGAFIPWS